MDINEKIDAYFTNKLSPEEREQFEKEIQANPDARKEFELQSDISQALKEIRVAELKASLDSVPISTGLLDSTLSKLVAAVVIITGVSIVGYLTWPQNEQSTSTPTQTEERSEAVIDSAESTKESEAVEEEVSEADPVQPQRNSTPSSTPDPVTPDVIEEFSDEETQENVEVPVNDVLESTPKAYTGLGIEILKSPQYNFHYRFENNKLYLYGDFGDELYDILEIKSENNSSLFFAYKDKFYGLDRSKEQVTALEEIVNQEIIQQLISIRNQE